MSDRRTQKRRRWPWVVAALVAVALVAGFLLLRNNFQNSQAEFNQALTGDRAVAFVGDLASTTSSTGRLIPQSEATLTLNSSGRVDQVLVSVGDRVEAGDPLVQLDTSDLARNLATTEQTLIIQQASLDQLLDSASAANIAASQAAVNSAQAALDALLDGPTEEQIASAEAQVRSAQANLTAAYSLYDQVTEAPDDADLLSAQIQLQNAEERQLDARRTHEQTLLCTTIELPNGSTREFCASDEQREIAEANAVAANAELAAAQAQYDAVAGGATAGATTSASAGIASAQAALDSAQTNLDLLMEGSNEVQLAAAESQLIQAQANLDQLLSGASAEQVSIAEAQVEQARIAVAQAQLKLDRALLSSPAAGIITAVFVAEGEIASGPAVTLIDEDSFEVVLSVDEVDLATIQEGQEAIVILEAYPDVEIAGAVRSVAPESSGSSGGLVTYDVFLSLADNALPLLSNMTANADLVASSRENVLLVPNEAIIAERDSGKYFVNLADENAPMGFERTEITIGARDNRFTEIVSGIEEGAELVIGEIELPAFFGGPPGGGNGNGNGGGVRFGGGF